MIIEVKTCSSLGLIQYFEVPIRGNDYMVISLNY